MKQSSTKLRTQIAFSVALALVLLWAGAAYEVFRSYQTHWREAEVKTLVQSQVFAEYSRSTIKRINEFALDLRAEWHGDWKLFAQAVQRRKENIDDLTFQVAIIDRDGILAYSNLAKPTERTDLSEREHFKVHKESNAADRLFISKPLKGTVSGRWSIQITRPVLKNGHFDGVIVISISPDQFAGFAEKLRLGPNSSLTVVRSSGEIMARYPADQTKLGHTLKNRVFLDPEKPSMGNYQAKSEIDGHDRIFGYYKIPEYGMIFIQGETVSDVLAPFYDYQKTVLLATSFFTVLALSLFFALNRSLSSLERVRAQLDAIFSLSPDGFVSFDKDYCVNYISPTFSRLTGLEAIPLIGENENTFARQLIQRCEPQGNSTAAPIDLSAMRQVQINAGEQNNERHRHLIELLRPGKKTLEVGIRLSDLDSVSQILYFRDVTHETAVDRMKSEFLSTAAHELRTPMASIYGYSELLLCQTFPPEEQKDLIGIIYQQSELMISIINDLLDLVRIEDRRKADFLIAQVNISKLIADIVSQFKHPANRAAPNLSNLDPLINIQVDRNKIQQAVSNVLSNAYKYSPQGGPVNVSLVQDKSESDQMLVGIRITDEGIGMTPDQCSRVFERFYRADFSGKIPGTGLGMSIVKELIELQGGRVSLISQINKGTEVTLWLPVEAS